MRIYSSSEGQELNHGVREVCQAPATLSTEEPADLENMARLGLGRKPPSSIMMSRASRIDASIFGTPLVRLTPSLNNLRQDLFKSYDRSNRGMVTEANFFSVLSQV